MRLLSVKALNRIAALVVCCWALGGCTARIEQAPPPTPVGAEYPADLQGATLYRIAPERSKLHVLVYRGGTLANLGHNHVVSCATLSGYVWLHESPAKSGFTVQLPVNELLVDTPESRAEEGADFAAAVSDSARAGTKRNMLKPEQLDGLNYPSIRLRSLRIRGSRTQPQVHVQITIRDQAREFDVPVKLSVIDKALTAAGEFSVNQTDFGIQPYSVAMGAIQVVDRLTIKFSLVATAMSPPDLR